jgi:hypothetical protein
MRIASILLLAAACAASAVAQAAGSFTYTSGLLVTGTPVTFTDTSTNPGILANLWQIDGQYYGAGCGCRTYTVNHTFSTPGMKSATLIVIYGNGGTASTTQSFNVALQITAAPTAVATAGCAPMLAQVNGSGSSSPYAAVTAYQWAFSDGFTASGVSAVHILPNVGAYWADLTITDALGHQDTTRINFTVGGPVASVAVVGGLSRCVGDVATIQTTLSGTPPFTLYWSDGLVETISQAGVASRTKNLPAPGSSPLNLNNFSDATGCAPLINNGNQTFIVGQPATAVITGDAIIGQGEYATLTVTCTGAPPFSVTWQDGLQQTLSGYSATRIVAPAATASFGLASLTQNNACGAALPTPHTVLVTPSSPPAGKAYTVDGTGGHLRRVRLADGVTEATFNVSIPGYSFNNLRGIARRPGTHDYYVLATNNTSSAVALLNTNNGVGTLVGTWPDVLRSCGFDSFGRLLVVGQANFFLPPPPISEVNLASGALSFVATSPIQGSVVRIAASPNSLQNVAVYGGALPDPIRTMLKFDINSFASQGQQILIPLNGGPAGVVDGLSYANGYDFVMTVGASYFAVYATYATQQLGTFDHQARGIACAPDAFVGLRGSGDGLFLESAVNGVYDAQGRKSAAPGATMSFRCSSPSGLFDGQAAVLFVDAYVDGFEPVLSPYAIDAVHVSFPAAIMLAIDTIPANGSFERSYVVPPGAAGIVLRTQCALFSAQAAGGLATSEGREILLVP